MHVSPVIFVGREIDLSATCGDGADLQTLCEDGRWSARVRHMHVSATEGSDERGAIRALAASFREIATRLEREAEDLSARSTTRDASRH